MFKKKDQQVGEEVLVDRIRSITGGYMPAEREYKDTHIRGDKRAERESIYKHATIQLRDGERLAVVMKNISETGARIEFFKNIILSDVVFVMEPTLKIRTWAEVMWHDDGAAGVKFVES